MLHAPDYSSFRKYKVADPAPNTLGWFLDRPEFLSWRDGQESSLLWIQGSAGQGKTILTKFLLNHFESIVAKAEDTIVIYFFFYDQDDALRTIGSALRALIRQLLSATKVETFRAISEKLDLNGLDTDEVGLWDVLERLLEAPMLNRIFCVIDALDEADVKLRENFTRFLKRLTLPAGNNKLLPVLKTLLVSRPTVDIGRHLRQCPVIDLGANPRDLKAFVEYELGFFSQPIGRPTV